MELLYRIVIFFIFSTALSCANAQSQGNQSTTQQNYNTSGTNVGTNNGTINVTTYPGTSKSAVNENYNSNYNDPECSSKNCGDICFFNQTNRKISVRLNYSTITVSPGEANCFYQVPSGSNQYFADLDPDNRIMNPANPSGSDHMRNANVFIEKCKSKSVVIR